MSFENHRKLAGASDQPALPSWSSLPRPPVYQDANQGGYVSPQAPIPYDPVRNTDYRPSSAMSISQLLSPDPPAPVPHQKRQDQPYITSPTMGHRNGIQSLLNDDHPDPLVHPDPILHHETTPSGGSPKPVHGNGLSAPMASLMGEHDARDKRMPSTSANTGAMAVAPPSDVDTPDGDDDDDPDDDSDVEGWLEAYKPAMVEYMLAMHRRKKRVIRAYEKKRQRMHSKMHQTLDEYYDKQYGSDRWRLRGGLEIPSALFHKVKQTNDRFKQRRERLRLKPSKKRALPGLSGTFDASAVSASDLSDDEHTDTRQKFLDPNANVSEKRLQAERKRVWLEIARTDIPRMARILTRVQATRSGNCKKLAQYCQKEIKRTNTKNGRATRDIQIKAKQAQKQMLLFWKKNEKEERELRKKAEKEALERMRQEEERREAQRQARKLNFLITQTELYSHFIGRKIHKDVADDDDSVQQSPADVTPADATPTGATPSMDLDITSNAPDDALGELDFDEEDEEVLKEHARRSAQNALAKQREQTRKFDEAASQRRQDANTSDVNVQDQLDEMNFQEPSSMGTGPEIKQPNMLMCQLKSYQLKGLNWLANLYDQGINGILADEMGLGKTVQSISLMAYLAEVHNIWGPFLVIAPASTLHNWQQEISKFVPSFRALPYWGSPKERKILRQSWTRKQIYGKDAPFHIVITSYQLILTDVTYFQRVKWQYMVLDEAQAIKSSSSARWKTLLGFHCRNRLLLTGTPIQNSMQELWALLHFIMPSLFDSHDEFSEWFSKDIESHAENRGTLNEHQLKRLHMILKPFMLRRIKRNVQHELGEKIEIEMFCELTARQRALYRGLKEKISIAELLEKVTSLSDNDSMDSLMNLVMQFRKVCNHPELFERADVEAPASFVTFGESGPLSKEQFLYCPYSATNPIKYHLPKLVYRHGGCLDVPGPDANVGFTTHYLDNLMSIWDPAHIYESMNSSEPDASFSFLRFADTSACEASHLFRQSILSRWLFHLAQRDHQARRRFYALENDENDQLYASAPLQTFAKLMIASTTSPLQPTMIEPGTALYELTHIADQMVPTATRYDNAYIPAVRSVPIDIMCPDIGFTMRQNQLMHDPSIMASLFGKPHLMNSHDRTDIALAEQVVHRSDEQRLVTIPSTGYGYSQMRVPSMRDLILDSGKLAVLDKLLERLKNEGHRCLIYFQMTRMIDLFEEYIAYKQYKYLRLDGSSRISDRRDMVQDWQTRPEIFIFLLSTRAGGLGINLTAADTVIFYDSDWNPTVDQQAMDRAHRLGQTKQVTVYRLLTKGTIEERILMRAKQKDEIQKVVISGGEFKQSVDFNKPKEIVSLLLDDDELNNNLIQQQLKRNKEIEKEKKKDTNKKLPVKRARKSNASTPAQSPMAVDRLFSAGGDTLPEDIMDGQKPADASPAKKKSRIGRPRTNISFTG
ncbi:SNF2 family N-terminal domain-containing protein [Gongronella butleri]|nr:SNF2 family N-terminal domain-containing protein [Gongronella butleri]